MFSKYIYNLSIQGPEISAEEEMKRLYYSYMVNESKEIVFFGHRMVPHMSLQKMRHHVQDLLKFKLKPDKIPTMGREDRHEVSYLALGTDFEACVLGWLNSILFY